VGKKQPVQVAPKPSRQKKKNLQQRAAEADFSSAVRTDLNPTGL